MECETVKPYIVRQFIQMGCDIHPYLEYRHPLWGITPNNSYVEKVY